MPSTEGITVVIPTITPRRVLLDRALRTVERQTLRADAVVVQVDSEREGAAATRNRALRRVTTPWVAFLDDDDEWYPQHLRCLARYARLTPADVIYPYFDCDGDDVIGMFGVPFDGLLLGRANFIPVTVLARTEKVLEAGGFQDHPDKNGDPCEDWGLWLAMRKNNCRFAHLPLRTWLWHNNDNSTRGRPDRW